MFVLVKKKLRKIKKALKGNPRFYDGDVFLVSYPRSGNTWARFLLANLLVEEYVDVDFHSIQKLIPDLEIEGSHSLVSELKGPRIFKSHQPYHSGFDKVIYLVRDGRDVMVSYYWYMRGNGEFAGSFNEFLSQTNFPYGYWHNHVDHWLSTHPNILQVRYEDVLANTHRELERMTLFAKLPVSSDRIEQAVEKSSFSQMRQIEQEKGRPFQGTQQYHFVRRGISNQWCEMFDDQSREIFKTQANQMLKKLGYIDSFDW